MAVKINNSFEASFENLSTKAKQVTKTVVSDVKQQVTGQEVKAQDSVVNSQGDLMQQLGLKPLAEEKKENVEQKQNELLSQTRNNLDKINREIEEARKKRLKVQESRLKEEQQVKQQKKVEENKKKEDPFWKKALRGKTGSQEAAKNVSG